MLLTSCPRCKSTLPEAPNFCDNCGLRLAGSAEVSWWALERAETSTPALQPIANTGSVLVAEKVAAPPPPPPLTPQPTADSRLQQYIPTELLKKLEAARASGTMAGERRVVTMLFCDVKGSTAAAEQMDPEEWSDIINGAFEQMIRPIYKYEGMVARLMGDGILAFFGAPIAHEDDPQRAVLAGLDIVAGIKPYCDQIRQSHGISLEVRVGINTGLVVVGAVGSDLRMEYTALGDAINLASRMEQTAAPGTVQIAHDTYKLVKSLFEFEDLGGIQVKGKSEPVPAYRVLRRKVLGKRVRGIEGLQADIVGREPELLALQNVIAGLKQGVGHIVCLLGDAGLGKSRLVNECYQHFKDKIGGEGIWFETTSLSYETHQAYGLFQRLIRRITGVSYEDAAPEIRERLVSLVENLPEERRPRSMQVFEALFGIEAGNGAHTLEGEAFKRELFETMYAWWQIRFSERPAVLVFDDLHWGDMASIELLKHLLPLTGEIPLVLMCAMRPEREAPAWEIKKAADEEFRHHYTELLLHPLSDSDSNELINRLLAIADLPEQLRASILEKASGNPFFIEEVVRTLIDSGVVVSEERMVNGERRRYWQASSEQFDFSIPDNLQSLLAARMDLLEEATRKTLQVAAVIGRSFYHRVLQAVDEPQTDLDKRLSTLLRLEMIREAARMPEVQYAFRNPLTQEAVYKTILLKRRREFHRRVGEAMEMLYPDRLEGQYGLLAYHFALAGERDKAIQYSRRAARQAVALFAYDDAIRNQRIALELVEPETMAETHLALLEELADIYRLLRKWDDAFEHYRRALEVWDGIDGADQMTCTRLHRKIVQMVADVKWTVGLDYLQQANEIRLRSRARLEESLGVLESQPPHLETVQVLITLSTDSWRLQNPPDWEAAQRYAEPAVRMAEQLGSPLELSQALGALATVLDGRSLLREHLNIAQKRLSIVRAEGFDDIRETIEALRCVGSALLYVGEFEPAIPYLKEAEELAARSMLIDQHVSALMLQGQCWFWLDRWDEVLNNEEIWRDLEKRYSRERVGET